MRTTITIDDDLFDKAASAAGSSNASEVVKAALRNFVSSESRKRLIALGGSAPHFSVPGRDPESEGTPLGLVAEDAKPYGSE